MKVRGFTLVEVTVTLFIATCIFLLGIGLGTHTLASLQERLFFNELRQTWFATIYQGEQQKQYTWIQFEPKKVKFSVGQKTLKILVYPKSLTPTTEYQELSVSGLGSLTPTTETFTSTLGKEYRVHFQLGYGTQYRVEENMLKGR
ncbi:comG operon protein 4 (comGD) [Ligilactobacillus murinus]|uniref:comG operon protein 4 (comGD) n=1 Tax=Ligilactobacillus murinus TaxID=1622 RepID=UPI001072AFD7|nr:comG operon protein 4 (comGD) [Ligilactobacillus murinus]MBF0758454.1 comG operon protein 4 (comGD) [Ligilactobacillus murinus]MBF0831371.1 comG operon protein 4 (comGD) [Ligilactobacillus murinus]TFU64043.1 comG operon protein 4 (comGD) [Ligilactobacillus murinus]